MGTPPTADLVTSHPIRAENAGIIDRMIREDDEIARLTGSIQHSTERAVTLRPLTPADADVVAGWGTDAQFCREADWAVEMPLVERRRRQRSLIESPPPELIRLGSVHNGILIGYVDLHGAEPLRRELGFLIGGRARWGHGLGCLTARAGLDYGFGQLGLKEVWAEALDANHRSVSILRQLGLHETGDGIAAVYDSQPSYYRQFAITAEEWARKRTR